jgi:hypothetical protein
MSKSDRLAHIIEVYLTGNLELATAAAELLQVYVHRGWRFSLVESDCDPQFREPMRALARQVDELAQTRRTPVFIDPPIVIH